MHAKDAGQEAYLFPFRNMLSMKGQRFKAQPLARLGLPYEVPRHLPHSEGGLIETEGGLNPIPKNQPDDNPTGPQKLTTHTRATEELTHHTQRAHTPRDHTVLGVPGVSDGLRCTTHNRR